MAELAKFFTFTQCGDRPARYGPSQYRLGQSAAWTFYCVKVDCRGGDQSESTGTHTSLRADLQLSFSLARPSICRLLAHAGAGLL
jgi:hypothetical protein